RYPAADQGGWHARCDGLKQNVLAWTLGATWSIIGSIATLFRFTASPPQGLPASIRKGPMAAGPDTCPFVCSLTSNPRSLYAKPEQSAGRCQFARGVGARSEEHTSELQPRENLVCR